MTARDETEWKARAACAEVTPDIFFPESDQQGVLREAIKICQSCPVRAGCAEYAINNEETHGIWGGLTQAQLRLKVAAKRRAAIR